MQFSIYLNRRVFVMIFDEIHDLPGIIRKESYFCEFLWILSMCKCSRFTHKLDIKRSELYSVCDWFTSIFTFIKSTKMNFMLIHVIIFFSILSGISKENSFNDCRHLGCHACGLQRTAYMKMIPTGDDTNWFKNLKRTIIRKHAYSNIWKTSPPKTKSF